MNIEKKMSFTVLQKTCVMAVISLLCNGCGGSPPQTKSADPKPTLGNYLIPELSIDILSVPREGEGRSVKSQVAGKSGQIVAVQRTVFEPGSYIHDRLLLVWGNIVIEEKKEAGSASIPVGDSPGVWHLSEVPDLPIQDFIVIIQKKGNEKVVQIAICSGDFIIIKKPNEPLRKYRAHQEVHAWLEICLALQSSTRGN
jgi:hypothetical protein